MLWILHVCGTSLPEILSVSFNEVCDIFCIFADYMS